MPFNPETLTRLQEGASLVLGTVSTSGEPHAGRGWGIATSPEQPDAIRLLLDASDDVTIRHCDDGGRVALTIGNVRTYKSLQIKGSAVEVSPIGPDYTALAERYCEDFFRAVVQVDRHSRAMLESWRPRDFVACTIRVESMYDQTPGPRAGAAVAEGGP
jgi:hypothetical protein